MPLRMLLTCCVAIGVILACKARQPEQAALQDASSMQTAVQEEGSGPWNTCEVVCGIPKTSFYHAFAPAGYNYNALLSSVCSAAKNDNFDVAVTFAPRTLTVVHASKNYPRVLVAVRNKNQTLADTSDDYTEYFAFDASDDERFGREDNDSATVNNRAGFAANIEGLIGNCAMLKKGDDEELQTHPGCYGCHENGKPAPLEGRGIAALSADELAALAAHHRQRKRLTTSALILAYLDEGDECSELIAPEKFNRLVANHQMFQSDGSGEWIASKLPTPSQTQPSERAAQHLCHNCHSMVPLMSLRGRALSSLPQLIEAKNRSRFFGAHPANDFLDLQKKCVSQTERQAFFNMVEDSDLLQGRLKSMGFLQE